MTVLFIFFWNLFVWVGLYVRLWLLLLKLFGGMLNRMIWRLFLWMILVSWFLLYVYGNRNFIFLNFVFVVVEKWFRKLIFLNIMDRLVLNFGMVVFFLWNIDFRVKFLCMKLVLGVCWVYRRLGRIVWIGYNYCDFLLVGWLMICFIGIDIYIVIEDLMMVVNVVVILECLLFIKGELGIGKIMFVIEVVKVLGCFFV